MGKYRALPPVGRARGLLAIWQETRREQEIRLRRGGIWSPVSVTPGQGRAATLALLCEVANENTARASSPIHHQRRGRGRGLTTPFHDYPYIPSGMERARSRNTGPHPCSFPDSSLQIQITRPWYLCLQGNIPNPSPGPNPPPPEAPSGPPSLESMMSS